MYDLSKTTANNVVCNTVNTAPKFVVWIYEDISRIDKTDTHYSI